MSRTLELLLLNTVLLFLSVSGRHGWPHSKWRTCCRRVNLWRCFCQFTASLTSRPWATCDFPPKQKSDVFPRLASLSLKTAIPPQEWNSKQFYSVNLSHTVVVGRGTSWQLMNIDFFLSHCAAGFWPSGFTLTELSEGGLFNGVLWIHREVECRLVSCLHDILAAGFSLWCGRQMYRLQRKKAEIDGERERERNRICLNSVWRQILFLYLFILQGSQIKLQINKIWAAGVFIALPLKLVCGAWLLLLSNVIKHSSRM